MSERDATHAARSGGRPGRVRDAGDGERAPSPAGTRVVVAPRFRSGALARALREDPARLLRAGSAAPGGRSEHRLLPLDGEPDRLRLRPGRRGGWLGPWLGDRYAGPGRVLREHALTRALFEAGLPAPEPAFALALQRGLVWRTAIATVDREDGVDAHAFLANDPSRSARVAAARAIAVALRRLHDAGVVHGDLQLRNLLLVPGAAGRFDCIVVDFDRARRGPPATPRQRMREWMRLVRSCEKSGRRDALDARVLAAALGRYCAGDRRLRRAMRERLPAEQARLRRHRRAWPSP